SPPGPRSPARSTASPGTPPSRPVASSSATRSGSRSRSRPSRPRARPSRPDPAARAHARVRASRRRSVLRAPAAVGVPGRGSPSGRTLAGKGRAHPRRVDLPEALDGAVDLDDGHVLPVPRLELGVGVDVDLPPPHTRPVALGDDDATRLVAQVTTVAGEEGHSDVGHAPILRAAI